MRRKLPRWPGGAVLRRAGAVPAREPRTLAPGRLRDPALGALGPLREELAGLGQGRKCRRVAGSAGPELRCAARRAESRTWSAARRAPNRKRGRTPSHGVTGWRLAALHPLVREGKHQARPGRFRAAGTRRRARKPPGRTLVLPQSTPTHRSFRLCAPPLRRTLARQFALVKSGLRASGSDSGIR
jgi:hypothetical protein